MNTKPDPMNRRDFVTASGLAAISAAALAAGAASAPVLAADKGLANAPKRPGRERPSM